MPSNAKKPLDRRNVPGRPKSESRPAIPVAVALVLRPGRDGLPWILIDHRFPDAHLPDLWEFPGGKILPGESGEACAVREVLEETGVRVSVVRYLMRRSMPYPDRSIDLRFYLCAYQSGIPRSTGCQAVRWVKPANLPAYPFPLANDPILDWLRREGWFSGKAEEPVTDGVGTMRESAGPSPSDQEHKSPGAPKTAPG